MARWTCRDAFTMLPPIDALELSRKKAFTPQITSRLLPRTASGSETQAGARSAPEDSRILASFDRAPAAVSEGGIPNNAIGERTLQRPNSEHGAGGPGPRRPNEARSNTAPPCLAPSKDTNSGSDTVPGSPSSSTASYNTSFTASARPVVRGPRAATYSGQLADTIPRHSVASAATAHPLITMKTIALPRVVRPRAAVHTGAPPTDPIPDPPTAAAGGRDIEGVVHLRSTAGRQVTGRSVRPIPPPPPPATDVGHIIAGTVRLHGTGERSSPWPHLVRDPAEPTTINVTRG